MAKCSCELPKEELQNKVTADWIPFTEAEVDAKECFASHFMSDYHVQPGANPNALSRTVSNPLPAH